MNQTLQVLSQNMSVNNGDPERRYDIFADTVLTSPPDLLLVQEVSSDIGHLALSRLTERLGAQYSYTYATVYPGQETEQGVAIISGLPVLHSSITDFEAGGNQAQLMDVRAGNTAIALANVHLEASPRDEKLRLSKLKAVSNFMKQERDASAHLVAGDINSPPFYPSVLAMKHRHGFTSAYQAVHGTEPAFTFPALRADELVEGHYIKPAERVAMQRLAKVIYAAKRQRPEIPSYTLDYVFTNDVLKPVSATTIRSKTGSTTPISDHLGLQVSFEL